MSPTFSAVVAGLICLDIIPRLDNLPPGQFAKLFQPGRLIETGPAAFSAGGAVSNTGLALHKLGVPTQLMGKLGADMFGQALLDIVRTHDAHLASGMIVDASATTAYSVIINVPGVDRIFLHHPGANHTFCADDVRYTQVAQAALFHFGYPPLMRRMFEQTGAELAQVFRRAKETGVTTSLDLALPDPASPGGCADWPAIFRATLPYVDIFLPSLEELLFTLRPETYTRLLQTAGDGNLLEQVTPGLLAEVSAELLQLGVKIVVIKLGDRGLYLRTAQPAALEHLGRAAPTNLAAWANQELWAPCFQVTVAGTTGAGDATIAGFLSALLRDKLPGEAVTIATAVGACNVEAPDALSGLRSWETTLARINSDWPRHTLQLDAPGWQWDARQQLWQGPARL